MGVGSGWIEREREKNLNMIFNLEKFREKEINSLFIFISNVNNKFIYYIGRERGRKGKGKKRHEYSIIRLVI